MLTAVNQNIPVTQLLMAYKGLTSACQGKIKGGKILKAVWKETAFIKSTTLSIIT